MVGEGDSKFLFDLPSSIVVDIGVLNTYHASRCQIDVAGAVILEL